MSVLAQVMQQRSEWRRQNQKHLSRHGGVCALCWPILVAIALLAYTHVPQVKSLLDWVMTR